MPIRSIQSNFSKGIVALLVSLIILLKFLNGLAIVPESARPWLTNLLIAIFPLTLLLLVLKRDLGPLPGLRKETALSMAQAIVAIFLGFVLILAFIVIDQRLGRLVDLPIEVYETWTHLEDARIRGDDLITLAIWPLMAAFAAVIEETTYKSLFIRAFLHPPSKFVFVAFSSFLFAIIHIEYGLAWVFIVGLGYAVPSAVYYYETRHLGTLIVMHFTMNLVSSSNAISFK